MNIPHPKIRLDFMLVNEVLINQYKRHAKDLELSNHRGDKVKNELIREAKIDISNVTDTISDHYPVMLSYPHLRSSDGNIDNAMAEATWICQDDATNAHDINMTDQDNDQDKGRCAFPMF